MQNTSIKKHPCASCAFYTDSVWQPIASCSVSSLSRAFSRKGISKGQALFHQGDESKGVFCVSKGLIALRTHREDGNSTLLRLVYPGEVIGFRSFLASRCHRTEARALLASRVCVVAQRDAEQVVHTNPSVMARLASRCVSEIDRNHDRIISVSTTPNKQRLIDVLLRLMEAHGERAKGFVHMQLPLSRSDLADLIGVQHETVSRLFKRIQDDGLFTVSGRNIRMPVAALPAKRAVLQFG